MNQVIIKYNESESRYSKSSSPIISTNLSKIIPTSSLFSNNCYSTTNYYLFIIGNLLVMIIYYYIPLAVKHDTLPIFLMYS